MKTSSPSSSSSSVAQSQAVYDEIILSLDVTRKVINDGNDTMGSLFKVLKPAGKLIIEASPDMDEAEKKEMCFDLQLAGYLINSSANSDNKIEASKPGISIGTLYSLLLPPLPTEREF